MKNILFSITTMLIFTNVALAQYEIIEDYGELDGLFLFQEDLVSERVGSHIAVTTDSQDKSYQGVSIINSEGNLVSVIPTVFGDSLNFPAQIYTYDNKLVLMGYERKSEAIATLDSADLSKSRWCFRQYDEFGNLELDRCIPVLPKEIGFPLSQISIGVNQESVKIKPSSVIGTVSEDYFISFNHLYNIDSTRLFTGEQSMLFYVYDKIQDTIYRTFYEEGEGFFLEDMMVVNDSLRIYGVDLSTREPKFIVKTPLPEFNFSYETLDSVYSNESTLPFFGEQAFGRIYEVSVDYEVYNPIPLFSSPGDMIITEKILQGDTLRSKVIRNKYFPFGTFSLRAAVDSALFLVGVDVKNRNPLNVRLFKIDIATLDTLWDIPLNDGLFRSLVPMDDGGCLVFSAPRRRNDDGLYDARVIRIKPTPVSNDERPDQEQLEVFELRDVMGQRLVRIHPAHASAGLQYSLRDMQGRMVDQGSINGAPIRLDLRAGMYVITAHKDGRLYDVEQVVVAY